MKMVANKKPVPRVPLSDLTGETDLPVPTPEEIKKQQEEQAKQEEITELVAASLINLSDRLDPPPVAMQIVSEGKPVTLFTKGNFSIITGAAKSRKSFLVSLMVAAAIKGKIQDLFICNGSGISIIFDTEQAKYKVQQIGKRICDLSGTVNPSNLLVYSLRTLEPAQRIEVIESVLTTTPNINFVAIDGIIDLEIDPILQADQAQKVVMKLMQWSEIYNIHITCVLHYNKTVQTLLGHLGSFSHRKADAVIEVSKSKEDNNVSIVKPVDCREKEFTPFAFSVDQYGMPYILQDYVIETPPQKEAPKIKRPAFSFSNLDTDIKPEILKAVFKLQKEQAYTECWRNIKNSIETITGEKIGDNKAKDSLACFLATEEIIKVDPPKGKPVYVLAGQKSIDF